MAAKSEALSYFRVLIDCRDSIKRLTKLEKVVPGLLERKAVPKKLGKKMVKHEDTELLLGWMNSDLGNFIAFLDVLASVSDDEEHRDLMKVLSGSLCSMRVRPDSDAETSVKRFIAASHADLKSTSIVPTLEHTATVLSEPILPTDVVSGVIAARGTDLTVKDSDDGAELLSATTQQPRTQSSTPEDDGGPPVASVASPPEVSTLSLRSTHPPPSQPPSGYLACVSATLTQNGGVLYSPEYGIMVTVPAESLPPCVGTFLLSAYIYLQGPFSTPEDAELCTPVVWLSLEPNFTFVADVTLKFSHSAFIPGGADLHRLCLWRAHDLSGPTYDLLERVDADFSDGYHVIAHVRHFSPHAATISKKRKTRRSWSKKVSRSDNHSSSSPHPRAQEKRKRFQLKRLQSQANSSSVESHSSVDSNDPSTPLNSQQSTSMDTCSAIPTPSGQDQSLACPTPHQTNCAGTTVDHTLSAAVTNQFCIAKCVPRDRSTSTWEAVFYISYHHAAGVKAIRLAAESRFGLNFDLSSPKRFQFSSDDLLEFQPSYWNENGWRVFATDGNHQIERDEVVILLSTSPTDSRPHVTYAVQTVQHLPSVPLNCEIEVLGAQVRSKLQYVLTSTAPSTSTGINQRALTISSNLYPGESQLVQCLSQRTHDLSLNVSTLDHRKLLAELSLQINDPRKLAHTLQLAEHQVERILADYPSDEAEQIYHVLTTWVAGNFPNANLTQLLQTVRAVGVLGLELVNRSGQFQQHFEVATINDRMFLVNMGEKLQRRWKFVARLLGVSESTVDGIAYDNPQVLNEQSYQMLGKWKRSHGDGATYGVLSNAVHTVYIHDPDSVNDAWLYIDQSHTTSYT